MKSYGQVSTVLSEWGATTHAQMFLPIMTFAMAPSSPLTATPTDCGVMSSQHRNRRHLPAAIWLLSCGCVVNLMLTIHFFYCRFFCFFRLASPPVFAYLNVVLQPRIVAYNKRASTAHAGSITLPAESDKFNLRLKTHCVC